MPGAWQGQLLASASRTASTTVQGPDNFGTYRGVMLFLDVTTGAASETLSLQIQVQDPASAKWENITIFDTTTAAFAAQKVYILYPGAIETSAMTDQEVAGIPLPFRWRVVITHSSTGAWVYSLGYIFLP